MAWDDENERTGQARDEARDAREKTREEERKARREKREFADRLKDDIRDRVQAGMVAGIRGRGRRVYSPGGLGWGAVLVVIGTVLLMDHMGVIEAKQVWRFWPSLLIVAGIFNFFQCGRRVWGAVLLTLGVLFQLDTLGVAHFRWADLWPLALIFAGIFVIWGSIEARNTLNKLGADGGDPRTTLNEHVLFGGIERRVNSKQFRGGQLHAVFGGIEVDLRDAELEGDEATLVANSVFGGIEIRVPETWYVASHGQGIFGGFTDATKYRGVEDSTNPHRKTLIVKGAAVFGGVEIRN